MSVSRATRLKSESSGQLALPVQLDVEARFETYFGGSNAPAVAALQAPPEPGVWLSGEGGSGRSHLLQAVVATAPSGHAMYLPLRIGIPPTALEDLPGSLTVCIDDYASIAGNLDWERALMQLYERMLQAQGRLIIAADKTVAATRFTLPDWQSRCQSLAGFVLRPMDDDALLEALQLRAQHRGMDMSNKTLRYLLSRVPRDAQTLYDWLQRLDERALVDQRRVTIPFVRTVLRDAGIVSD